MIVSFLRSLVWLVLILGLGLGATFIVAQEIVRASIKPSQVIFVRDAIGIGSHVLSGTIAVPSTCDEVIVNTEQTSATSYAILFSTWRDPHITSCKDTKATREFHAIIFAPSLGTSFTATLNGAPVSIAVIPEIPLRASTSTR